jgi:hypothetical protein
MATSRFKTALIAVLILFSTAAFGHRYHAGITDVSMNPNTGNTELIHTYMAHDVESLLENLYQRQFDLTDPEDIAIFRRYVEKQFSIEKSDNSKLTLSWVGIKIDTNYVTVYQEIEKQALPSDITIRASVLMDFLPEQVNTINISSAGTIRTLSFTRNNREQRLP